MTNDWSRDLRLALRTLVKSPAYPLAVLAVLGLGLAGFSAVWAVAYGVLLRPLEAPEPERLVMVWQNMEARGGERHDLTSRGVFDDWRRESRSFAALAAVIATPIDLVGAGAPVNVPGAAVSHEALQLLGARAEHGRAFLRGDETLGQHQKVVLSQALWRERFGADPAVVGRTVELNGAPHEVVGVLPASFRWPLEPAPRLFLPLPLDPPAEDRGYSYVTVLGRLAPGVSLAAAEAETARLATTLAERHPEALAGVGIALEPLLDHVVGGTRPLLLLLLAGSVLLLAVAAANAVSLILARASQRAREAAVLAALGADRGGLLRRYGAEGLLLGLGSALGGLALGHAAVSAFVAQAPADLPRLDAVRYDGPVVVLTAALALALTVLVSLVPALRARRFEATATLRGGAAAVRRGGPLRAGLVVAQVAAAVCLLMGTGLLGRTLLRLATVEPGFTLRGLVAGQVTLAPDRYPESADLAAFLAEVEARLAATPPFVAATSVSTLPLVGGRSETPITIEGVAPVPGAEPSALYRSAAASFARTVDLPLVAGRFFDATDTADAAPVAVVNERFAGRYLAGRDPLGLRLRLGPADAEDEPWRRIVGVVGDTRSLGLDREAVPELFVPAAQQPSRIVTLIGKVPEAGKVPGGDAAAAVGPLERVVAEVRAGQVVAGVQSVEAAARRELAGRNLALRLFGLFAAVVLVLVAVGVYGLLALRVAERRRELAVRLALGGVPRAVQGRLMRSALALVALGLVAGLALGAASSKLLRGLLYGVEPLDPVSLALASGLVLALAFVAVWLPTRRIGRIAPAEVLKD